MPSSDAKPARTGRPANYAAVLAALNHPPAATGVDRAQVVEELASLGALSSREHTLGVAAAEELAARWLVDILGLPETSSVGFVAGGQMALFTCLAAARHFTLLEADWNVEADGLAGAPPVTVVVNRSAHATVRRALHLLGFGDRAVMTINGEDQDPVRPQALRNALQTISGPTIVALEYDQVAIGEFDAIADLAELHDAGGDPTWVHIGGAGVLRAAASPAMAADVAGLNRFDSWSADGRAMLDVDCGIAICRHPAAHRAAMSAHGETPDGLRDSLNFRDPSDWGLDDAGGARGVGVYATLRALGRDGVARLTDAPPGASTMSGR